MAKGDKYMINIENIFYRRKVNEKKLISYGFNKVNNGYEYRSKLLDNLEAVIFVSEDDSLKEDVIDLSTNERYAPLYQVQATGRYVGKVREIYNDLLEDIALNCFDRVPFNSQMTVDILSYINEKYHHQIEFPWDKSLENGIVRHPENNKWYAAILHVAKEKIGLVGTENIDVINLKNRPELIHSWIDAQQYLPAYHMNKKNWISIPLDGTVPLDEICLRIDESYKLTE